MLMARLGTPRRWLRTLRAPAMAAALVCGVVLPSACTPPPPRITYTYTINVAGTVHLRDADVATLAKLAKSTLNDSRGWSLGGKISFLPVLYGGDFTIWLASPDQLPLFSPICTSNLSCSIGRNVIINSVRFHNGTTYGWPASLTSYQIMVINHEVGHWLGLGHRFCPGPGAIAPVMQQQSISLQGCRANSWPTAPELATVAAARHL
jgi:hypothetical protein